MADYLTRDQVPVEETWNLADLYPGIEEWEQDLSRVEGLAEKLKSYDGIIDSGLNLLGFLQTREEVSLLFGKVYAFAMLKLDEDTRNGEAQVYLERAKQLSVKIGSAAAFFMPFLLSLDEDTLKGYLSEEKSLDYFAEDLLESFRYKPHVLSKEQEELLSEFGETMSVPSNTFGMINNADIKFGEVTDDDGKKVRLTRGMYAKWIEEDEREKRKQAYKAYYEPYMQLKNTIATTLAGAIKTNVTTARVRQYPSALEKSLFSDNVPKEVYLNLIRTTRENIGSMHRYSRLRKEQLGVDELRQYDLSVPLVGGAKREIPYSEAFSIMCDALAPLGEEYISILKEFRERRYLDVRETEGKRSGAYNLGVYGVHPYILLNHRDDLDSLSTLVHECGHGVHSWLSSKHQPQISARYSIFVAEVASTVNEVLLIHYLLENETDEAMLKYLTNQFVDQFKGTFFTQVMFAEFEMLTHEMAEKGEPLNAEAFSTVYERLFKDYFGPELVCDEEVKFGWARIPHFYRPFYVYKYATGYASAIDIATRIMNQEEGALSSYLEFLKSGSEDYPLELLRKTGVDLTKPEPIENALKKFSDLVEKLSGQ